mgnify:CR=1 FL=1
MLFCFFLEIVGGNGEVTASPKYNKSNSRAFNRDFQQQKQYRGNNRSQRAGANARTRTNEQPNSLTVSHCVNNLRI